ncbi:site-specific integrase [Catenuloplanes japonicus]|uniref:hypothetical protein n=1 Tax=Catenuloplanes japonicus TaxID=33876 RepID=UPI0012FCA699|nr:hypothetical protein [Catenuloplanes japonicus]
MSIEVQVPADLPGNPAATAPLAPPGGAGPDDARAPEVEAEIAAYAHYLRSGPWLSATTVANYTKTVRAFVRRHPLPMAEVTEAMVASFLDEAPTAETRSLYARRLRRWLTWAVAEKRRAASPSLTSPDAPRDIPADLEELIDQYTAHVCQAGGHAATTSTVYRSYVRGITAHYRLPGHDLTGRMIADYVSRQTLTSYQRPMVTGVIRRWRDWCVSVHGSNEHGQ